MRTPSNSVDLGSRTLALLVPLAIAACGSSSSPGRDAATSDSTARDATMAGDTGGMDATSDGATSANAPTVATLEAARGRLAGGATDVSWSPDGRLTYRRTRTGTQITRREVLVGGRTSVIWEYTATGARGRFDRDLDGVFERTVEITRGASASETRAVVTIDPEADGSPTRRETYTVASSTNIHVRIEVDDGSGTLETIADWNTTARQPAVITAPDPGTATGECTQAQIDQVRNELAQTIDQGLACAQRLGLTDLANDLAATIQDRGVGFECASLPGSSVAEIDFWDGLTGGFDAPVGMTIDPSRYFAFGRRQLVLWHELLHQYYGVHDIRNDPDDPRTAQIDPTYACSALCFDPNATKCQCASCLGVNKCDPRCAGFKDCPDVVGAQCRCLTRRRWYPTMTQCTVECPSGLSCFASDCVERSFACM